MENLLIKKFNFSNIKENAHILIIGKRSSGKTTLCKDLLTYFKNIKNINNIEVISYNSNNEYKNIIPENNIYRSYSDKIFENKINKSLMIFDDCLSPEDYSFRNKLTSDILFNARHYDISYILTTQYSSLSQKISNNIDHVFIFGCDNQENIKLIYEKYAGFFPSLSYFKEIFESITKKYQCMVINVGGEEMAIDKRIFHHTVDFENNCEKLNSLLFKAIKKNNINMIKIIIKNNNLDCLIDLIKLNNLDILKIYFENINNLKNKYVDIFEKIIDLNIDEEILELIYKNSE
jgi:hypothetical protein